MEFIENCKQFIDFTFKDLFSCKYLEFEADVSLEFSVSMSLVFSLLTYNIFLQLLPDFTMYNSIPSHIHHMKLKTPLQTFAMADELKMVCINLVFLPYHVLVFPLLFFAVTLDGMAE